MPADVYNMVKSWKDWPRMGTKFCPQRKLEQLPQCGPLKFVAVDILGLLPQSRYVKQFVVITTDRYNGLAEEYLPQRTRRFR